MQRDCHHTAVQVRPCRDRPSVSNKDLTPPTGARLSLALDVDPQREHARHQIGA